MRLSSRFFALELVSHISDFWREHVGDPPSGLPTRCGWRDGVLQSGAHGPDRSHSAVCETSSTIVTVEPRLLGLDFGDRRIGVAVSDELGLTAQPVLTLVRKNAKDDLKSLGRLLRKFGCSAIVLGNPLYMSGDVSPQATKTHAFAETLRVSLLPARPSLGRAPNLRRSPPPSSRRRPPPSGHREVVDQVAAVLILQSFLDAHRCPRPVV
jgi:putative holliday junction resolvase